MNLLARIQTQFRQDECGKYLMRYAVVVAAVCLAGFFAFTTVGQEFAHRVWALGDKIAGA